MKGMRLSIIAVTFLLLLSACSNSENQEAIEAAETAIAAIDLEDIDTTTVEEARTAYEALPDDAKNGVENYQVLVDAENLVSQQTELSAMLVLFDNGISECAMLRDIVVQVWGDTIHNGGNFNSALESLYRGQEDYWAGISEELASTFKEGIDLLKENHELLTEKLEVIKDFDIDDDVYDAIVDVYSEYSIFYDQVMSPSGSYVSYSADTNDTYNDLTRATNALALIWPY